MAIVNFTNLDFDQIKVSIKNYLKSNSNFTDYDFEGSNLSVLIDALAYNTYISSYNANMVTNEVFIDSATLRENVVSLARNIGYVPRSRTSARANISFFVDLSSKPILPLSITLKKGIVCISASSFQGESYTFAIPSDVTVPIVDGLAFFDNISIYEGVFATSNFVVDKSNPNQRFILENPSIDTSSISVNVRNNKISNVNRKFLISNSISKVDSKLRVFFLQEVEDQKYELIFGDGIIGEQLDNENYIEVTYIVTNGEAGNGISNFSFSGRLVDNNDNLISTGISLVTTNRYSEGGKEIESIQSIKKFAPQIYASQNRAVTALDYQAIIPQIYPEAESISVFGGEELDPPQYGKVFITIKPFNGELISLAIKENIKKLLKNYTVAGIVPEILDLKYVYVEHISSVYYNTNLAPSSSYVKTIVANVIQNYSDSIELNKYGAKFKYSKFQSIIDNSHESITSNITKISIRRDLNPVLNSQAEYEICFGNEFYVQNSSQGYNIKSSGFVIDGIDGTVYLSDKPNSDPDTGSLFFFRLDSKNQPAVIKSNVGTINYIRGEINLNPVVITSTSKFSGNTGPGQPIIEISASPESNDVIGLQDLYLQLDVNKSVINMVADGVSSGADISGSSFIRTSSYESEDLIRV